MYIVNKSSLILPAWNSHKDSPENEILIYALLDTQSETTFVIDDTCQALIGLSSYYLQYVLKIRRLTAVRLGWYSKGV